MSWRDVRPLAVGVPRRDDELLLSRLHDDASDETFYRPIGGALEFGELSHEALEREFHEELGVRIEEYELLETLEVTFTFGGTEGHEIWFLYEVSFVDDWPYERDEVRGEEDDGGSYTAVWLPVDNLDDVTVYPEDLGILV